MEIPFDEGLQRSVPWDGCITPAPEAPDSSTERHCISDVVRLVFATIDTEIATNHYAVTPRIDISATYNLVLRVCFCYAYNNLPLRQFETPPFAWNKIVR